MTPPPPPSDSRPRGGGADNQPVMSGPLRPPSGTAPIDARPAEDQCGAARMQYLIGQRVPASLATSGPVRIFASDDAVTMDYNPERLNIELDPASRLIVSVRCG